MLATPATKAPRSSTTAELLFLLWRSRDNSAVEPIFAAALELLSVEDSPHCDAPARGGVSLDYTEPDRLAGLSDYSRESANSRAQYRPLRGPALAPPCRRDEQSPSSRESAAKAEFSAVWGAGRKLSSDPAEARRIASKRSADRERAAALAAGLSIRAYRAAGRPGV